MSNYLISVAEIAIFLCGPVSLLAGYLSVRIDAKKRYKAECEKIVKNSWKWRMHMMYPPTPPTRYIGYFAKKLNEFSQARYELDKKAWKVHKGIV